MSSLDDLVLAAQREPRNPDVFLNLARAYADARHWARAADVFGEAFRLGLEPARQHLFEFAQVLTQKGEVDKAERLVRAVLVETPGDIDALFQLGPILSAQGQFEAAVEVLHRVLAARPDWPEAWEQLCFARRFTSASDPDIQRMRARVSADDCPAITRETLSFSLAKALDECAAFDDAFHYAALGNELQRERQGDFDHGAWQALIDATLRTFSSQRLALLRASGHSSERPIFIVGMPRSGTTLLEQMLSSHADVAGAGEIPFMSQTASQVLNPFPWAIDKLTPSLQESLALQYLDLYRSFGSSARVTDKFPGNLLYAGFIHALFPLATIVLVERDLADTAVSLYFQHFRRQNEFATSLDDIAFVYRHSQRLSKHWGEVLPAQFITVSYEALVNDAEPQLRRVLQHCGLGWDPACLRHAENRRPVLTLSSRQVRSPLYQSSVGRWQHYRSQLSQYPALLPAG